MNLRHAAALALVGWYLMMSDSSLAADSKSKLSSYTNPTYGVSFQYPSDWSLKEGDEAKLNWGFLGEVEVHLQQGVTIAAVVMPKDSYPGSDLQIAFLNVSVETSLSAAICNFASRKVRVGAIEFSESEDGDGGMGRSNEVQYYHVFRNQICYEFQLGEGVGGYGSATGIKSHVDDDAVFRRLKTILATVAIRSTTIALPRAKSKERQ